MWTSHFVVLKKWKFQSFLLFVQVCKEPNYFCRLSHHHALLDVRFARQETLQLWKERLHMAYRRIVDGSMQIHGRKGKDALFAAISGFRSMGYISLPTAVEDQTEKLMMPAVTRSRERMFPCWHAIARWVTKNEFAAAKANWRLICCQKKIEI